MNEPVQPSPGDSVDKSDSIVENFRLSITKTLTDGSRNNPLVYYRDNKSTRFTIGTLNSKMVTDLLSGSVLRAANFDERALKLVEPPVEPDTSPGETEGGSGSGGEALRPRATRATPADALQSRLRKIKIKAKENEDERGVRSLFAALGMVSWPASDGGRDPHAPLFLLPIAIEDDPRARGQFIVKRVEQSEVIINRTLLSIAPQACVDAIRALSLDDGIDDVPAKYEEVHLALKDIPNVTTTPTSAIGIFNFALMAMIDDLHQAGGVLSAHAIVRALAGDAVAQQELIGNRDGSVDINMLDSIPPIEEPFVLDADPWQTQSIQTLLKYPTSNAVIEGPPGTGKSQTIANLIAALIAQGKSVLFVCEKRAALDVVKRRLSVAGLDHLVLDMHGAEMTRKKIYGQLQRAAVQLRSAPAPTAAMDGQLEVTRDRLNEHVRDMHSVIPTAGLSLFQILGARAVLPTISLGLRIPREQLSNITPVVIDEVETSVREAARAPGLFLRRPDVPWALSALNDDDVPTAIDRVAAVSRVLKTICDALRSIGIVPATRTELVASLQPYHDVRSAFAVCDPAMLGLPPETLALALSTLSSPIGSVLEFCSADRKAAVRAVRAHLVDPTASRGRCASAISRHLKLEGPWKLFASTIAAWPADLDVAVQGLAPMLSSAAESLGAPIPERLDEAGAWIERCSSDRDGAYRSIRMREIRERLKECFLGSLVDDFKSLPPDSWASAVRYVWLESHLEPLRPKLARFSGRTHDDVVQSFARLEADLRTISGQRVNRAAGERYVAIANEHRDEQALVEIEIGRARPKKPLRELFSEAPHVMLGLAPCVMASPLSVSQLLPRATMFDIVVFDEGSQVAPDMAITSVMRGRRVVVAGDDKQLPPSDFFGKKADDDDEDGDESVVDAIEGSESFLGALKVFGRHLGLRVHYRSRDERLIAFSNHHLYDNALVTFPGSGGDGEGLNFVHVAGSGSETDELSSGPEVARVVELIINHAETRPDESLGVIAFGLTHARRIDAALTEVRKTRLDLDKFFSETGQEPFFVKNLERVQGDERDAIILSVGYGRTKTGRVSHAFGPLNHDGGERRLNVAITRAKSRLTLVSSFRKADLDPGSLKKQGAKLLAAYIGYAESAGRDLGRDGVVESVPPNAFELDIQKALEKRLGTKIFPQFGVSKFRIDLAVQHPEELGRFVLAVECDGATYHSTPTARMRDRLRQRVLEDLGWQFCRIWSTDWFNDREGELDRVEAAYRRAIGAKPTKVAERTDSDLPVPPVASSVSSSPGSNRVGPCPANPPYRSIADVSDRTLAELLAWIKSDGLLYTDADLSECMIRELGFVRHGIRIVERVESFIREHRS